MGGSGTAAAGRRLGLRPPLAPAEALLVAELPAGEGWLYEPKWDGFRCLVFREDESVELQSKSGQPLARYFPELGALFRALAAPRFVLDGEIVVRVGEGFSFDDLLQRIHPAESRVRKLAAERPASFVAFDLLADERGKSLLARPFAERRRRLEAFAGARFGASSGRLALSPATADPAAARRWLETTGSRHDGVVAKRLDLPYQSGERTGALKVKRLRSADCVVGGFRYRAGKRDLGSLLLGLYEDGLLHHVGFCSALDERTRRELLPALERRIRPPGFTGRAPGGPSRWSRGREVEWQPLAPEIVVEIAFDQVTRDRFRHGTRLVRFRPDKRPDQCGMDQLR